ncbi:MAG TPA: HAD family hydrolase [Armatimonadota bacterium]|jgi:HAD superfamily hydrolase (TIGR01509 family)
MEPVIPIVPRPLGVIFDLDGTLADTFPMIISAWNAAVREPLGRQYTPEEVIALFGVPEEPMFRHELPESEVERALEVYHEHYEAEHGQVEPFEGIPELLQAIADAGIPMGVVTGKGRRSADITMRLLGWDDYFASVMTGDDVERQKPHPEGALAVAQDLGVEARRCVFIGDTPTDVECGRAAAMTTIAAGWHTVYLDRLRDAKADYWADSPRDLQALLGV